MLKSADRKIRKCWFHGCPCDPAFYQGIPGKHGPRPHGSHGATFRRSKTRRFASHFTDPGMINGRRFASTLDLGDTQFRKTSIWWNRMMILESFGWWLLLERLVVSQRRVWCWFSKAFSVLNCPVFREKIGRSKRSKEVGCFHVSYEFWRQRLLHRVTRHLVLSNISNTSFHDLFFSVKTYKPCLRQSILRKKLEAGSDANANACKRATDDTSRTMQTEPKTSAYGYGS